jgi:hypothetical protein
MQRALSPLPRSQASGKSRGPQFLLHKRPTVKHPHWPVVVPQHGLAPRPLQAGQSTHIAPPIPQAVIVTLFTHWPFESQQPAQCPAQ